MRADPPVSWPGLISGCVWRATNRGGPKCTVGRGKGKREAWQVCWNGKKTGLGAADMHGRACKRLFKNGQGCAILRMPRAGVLHVRLRRFHAWDRRKCRGTPEYFGVDFGTGHRAADHDRADRDVRCHLPRNVTILSPAAGNCSNRTGSWVRSTGTMKSRVSAQPCCRRLAPSRLALKLAIGLKGGVCEVGPSHRPLPDSSPRRSPQFRNNTGPF